VGLTVGQILRQLMKDAGIHTAAELSDRTGVTDATLSRILNGVVRRPSRGTLEPLAAFFRVDVDDLRNGEMPEPRLDINAHTALDIKERLLISGMTPTELGLIDDFRHLTPGEQEAMAKTIRFLRRQKSNGSA
jgi:transcriptional regulator with XRE-family HTH domain